jgi:hypothetical protein
MPAGEIHCQCGIAGPQQISVRHELGTADHRHRAFAVSVSDQRSAVAAGYRRMGEGAKCVGRPEVDRPCLVRFAEFAIRRAFLHARGGITNTRGERGAGVRGRLDQQQIAGGVGQSSQQRFAGDALGLGEQ